MGKYFTARGDQGQTDQLGRPRISKAHLRIRAVGALDEASAALGLARAQAQDQEINDLIRTVQGDLYRVMTLVSVEQPNPEKFPDLDQDRINWLEGAIAKYGEGLPKLNGFILPGENVPSAALGLARTIVRRAEREVVALQDAGLLHSVTALPYLNRLSSLCFILELSAAGPSPAQPESGS